MNKILVAEFDTETAAYEGLTELKSLHGNGDITMLASSVVAKDETGKVAVRQADDAGPIGTVVGTAGGALVGLVAGPVGALVGGWIGGTGGFIYDLTKLGVGIDAMDRVESGLAAGKVALVAEVDETWTTPVDSRLEALGATIIRQDPDELIDAELRRESDAAEAEMRQLNAELERADGDARAKIEADIAVQRAKVEAIIDRIDAAVQQEKAQFETRLATLRAQLQSARDDARERIQSRIDEANAQHTARGEKLAEARMHAKSAIELTVEAVRV